jgi:hypothetical protein
MVMKFSGSTKTVTGNVSRRSTLCNNREKNKGIRSMKLTVGICELLGLL